MSTRYAIAVCDTNERAGNILENFLDTCKKFESVDVIGGSRLFANYQKNNVRQPNELVIIKSHFLNNYNMYFMTCFNEDATDIPKNNAYNQNLAEINNVVVLANGHIKNKEVIARQYEFSLGQSLQEFILGYYQAYRKKFPKDFNIANMIRDFESNLLSFAIFDKNLNEVYVYNRGDSLYISNNPGNSVIVSSEILPVNNIYPHYNFHKVLSNCVLKIDTKTMFVQYIPIYCNTFCFGRDIMLDTNKALLFTENCDMELYSAMSILSTKEITTFTDIQTAFFGFNTDIDKIIFDKITKLRKLIKVPGKLPVHIPYNFSNIYNSESEIIEEINKSIAETNKLKEESIDEENIKIEKKSNVNTPVTLKDSSAFHARKINFIASTLLNLALEKGVGVIVIPNSNRRNNQLISILRTLIKNSIYTPMYVYSLFDNFNTMDHIHYVMNCKEVHKPDDILINCDRSSLSFEINESKPELKFNVASDYNYDVVCAFMKCGMENPFSHRYIGKDRIDYAFTNAGIIPDKICLAA